MRRVIAVAAAFVGAILIAAPIGFAATPEQIYRDYADNGQLDGHYTRADLQRALKDAVIQGYPTHKAVKAAIKKKVGQVAAAKKTVPAVKQSGGLPFTGVDLALISVGGVSLLAFGAGLRRFARRTNN